MKPLKPKIIRHFIRYLGKILFLLACLFVLAMTSSAQNSYRLNKPPFYKSFQKTQLHANTNINYLPVSIDKMTSTEFFYQGQELSLQPLGHAINQYLDSLGWQVLPGMGEFSSISKGAPNLFVGSAESEIAPPSADKLREEFDAFPPMVLHVNKPSREWKQQLAQQVEQNQTEYVLLLWIGFNQYPRARKGMFKKKVVLGIDYEPQIRFLSAEDKPVEVLQLSGMIINKKGEVIKAGSEAFLHEDSPFWVQVLEAGTLIKDSDIAAFRREDLPGKPIAWQVALHHMLKELVNQPANVVAGTN